MDLRTNLIALGVVVGCVGAVTLRVISAPEPDVRRHATAPERVALARAIAVDERKWMKESVKAFPSDRWSQRDDFHARERQRMFELSNEMGVRIEEVIRAVDDDIHLRRSSDAWPLGAPDRNAQAISCKPRPFYD